MFFNLLTDTDDYKHYVLQKEAESASSKTAYTESISDFLK